MNAALVQVNMGYAKSKKNVLSLIFANLVLVEAQTLALSAVAAVLALVLGRITGVGHDETFGDLMLMLVFLIATAACSASLASIILGALQLQHKTRAARR